MIVIPIEIDFVSWASTLFIDLPTLDLPIARSEDNWKSWARETININQLAGAPSPQYYSDWRNWAYDFTNIVSNL